MQRWSFFVDNVEVQVSTRSGETGVYDLQWTIDGRPFTVTAAHADRSPMSEGHLHGVVRSLLAAADVSARAAERATGMVQDWREEEGWGVIDSPDTPGGCWAHFSAVRVAGYASLAPGQEVLLEWEAPGQDGFDYRAVGHRARRTSRRWAPTAQDVARVPRSWPRLGS